MTPAFILLSSLALGCAVLAMVQRKIIYTALLLVGTWLGIAGIYLWAGAEFTAFAQVIVYVGAVSMIVLFAVLLTNKDENLSLYPDTPEWRWRTASGLLIATIVSGLISGAILSNAPRLANDESPPATVKDIGFALSNYFGDALLVVGAILTVALLGAVIIASFKQKPAKGDLT